MAGGISLMSFEGSNQVFAIHDVQYGALRALRVWGLATGHLVGEPLTGHTNAVLAVTCTVLDGRPIAVTASRDDTVRLWDLRAQEAIAVVPINAPTSVSITAAGTSSSASTTTSPTTADNPTTAQPAPDSHTPHNGMTDSERGGETGGVRWGRVVNASVGRASDAVPWPGG
ncbi:hypothetical protein [Kitasatospora sp. NPDC056181]|uniref:hypothetical protein n=1 Tax=Kitasatospora sp. NPDC056181 TaxID=3345737 RepID=UPI0035DA2AC3